jgi:hypothetical protein
MTRTRSAASIAGRICEVIIAASGKAIYSTVYFVQLKFTGQ